jgi:GntR family transcriptional regulator/MocR family aminotransferase
VANSNNHSRRVASSPLTTSLLIRIDLRTGVALQQQIYSGIRCAILDGILPPRTRIPSSRALADDLGVSRTTTLLAFEQLIAEGYLAARRGSSTFVAHELPDDLPATITPCHAAHLKHPSLSRRAAGLSATPPPARRIGGPPRAFRIGTPAVDLFPVRLWSQLVNRRLRNVTMAQLDYGDTAGFPELRDAIAHQVQTARGTRCAADDVVVVPGARRGLELICGLLLNPGDEAWLEEPGYPGARSALVGAGARIVPVPVDEEGLNVEAGARLAGGARLAYITPSHQFPLGVPMSLPRRLALLKWAGAAGAWVIEDDYDSEFRHATRAIPCVHGLDVEGRVIYIGTFSKTLFPALRLGFLILPSTLRERLPAAFRAADCSPPLVDQAALADLLVGGHFDRHLRRMRSVYRERLEALTAAAERSCAGVLRIRPVGTGLHAVGDLDDCDAESVLEEAAVRHVEVTPLSNYFFNRSHAPNALVLGFGAVRPEALSEGMERLAAAIDAARRHHGSARPPRRAAR